VPGHGICRCPLPPTTLNLGLASMTAHAIPHHLETDPMSRPTGHPATRPFRLTRAAVEAHREHAPTPFLGCPVCARRSAMTPARIRWLSRRQG